MSYLKQLLGTCIQVIQNQICTCLNFRTEIAIKFQIAINSGLLTQYQCKHLGDSCKYSSMFLPSWRRILENNSGILYSVFISCVNFCVFVLSFKKLIFLLIQSTHIPCPPKEKQTRERIVQRQMKYVLQVCNKGFPAHYPVHIQQNGSPSSLPECCPKFQPNAK